MISLAQMFKGQHHKRRVPGNLEPGAPCLRPHCSCGGGAELTVMAGATVVANAVCGRRELQEEVRLLGGVELMLSQCQVSFVCHHSLHMRICSAIDVPRI